MLLIFIRSLYTLAFPNPICIVIQQIDNLRKQQYDYDSPLDEYSLIEEKYRTQIQELLQKIKVLEEQNAHLMTLLYQTYENTADK